MMVLDDVLLFVKLTSCRGLKFQQYLLGTSQPQSPTQGLELQQENTI